MAIYHIYQVRLGGATEAWGVIFLDLCTTKFSTQCPALQGVLLIDLSIYTGKEGGGTRDQVGPRPRLYKKLHLQDLQSHLRSGQIRSWADLPFALISADSCTCKYSCQPSQMKNWRGTYKEIVHDWKRSLTRNWMCGGGKDANNSYCT